MNVYLPACLGYAYAYMVVPDPARDVTRPNRTAARWPARLEHPHVHARTHVRSITQVFCFLGTQHARDGGLTDKPVVVQEEVLQFRQVAEGGGDLSCAATAPEAARRVRERGAIRSAQFRVIRRFGTCLLN